MKLHKYLDRFGTVISNKSATAVYFPNKLSEAEKREVRNAVPMWVWIGYSLQSQYVECPTDGPYMYFWRG